MTRIASHRGGTLESGDSTPSAFRMTAALPVDEVEFDLHPTADGHIVVHHDPTLDRTTDRGGEIAMLTLAEVKSARLNHSPGEAPLTLPELCAIFRPTPIALRCEIKAGADGLPYPGFADRVVAELKREGMLERTVFSSFLLEVAAALRPSLWLVSQPVLRQVGAAGVIALARTRSIAEIAVKVDLADAPLRDMVQAAGLEFGVYGAHSAAQIDHALALGVKVMTTDRPGLALERRQNFPKVAVSDVQARI
ncbi:glycerophosphodiester phosphodiesterase family protein [Cereibacter sp. SYSU M97828]|nr:glycerophosphodiester phosphodiesterase family protein [Cereibacter flavus]